MSKKKRLKFAKKTLTQEIEYLNELKSHLDYEEKTVDETKKLIKRQELIIALLLAYIRSLSKDIDI